jgi:excisionase family DNA binding protein
MQKLRRRIDIGAIVDSHPKIVSPADLAKILGIGRKTIYRWISDGRLDRVSRRRGKHRFIVLQQALELIFNSTEWR